MKLAHIIFSEIWVKMHQEYRVETRYRTSTKLIGSGNVFDVETGASYFQSEQRYAFDQKELMRDHSKLVTHIIDVCSKALFKQLREMSVQRGDHVLLLADDVLVPVWFNAPQGGEEGMIQVNIRWTLCFPERLPTGIPKDYSDHQRLLDKPPAVPRNTAAEKFLKDLDKLIHRK